MQRSISSTEKNKTNKVQEYVIPCKCVKVMILTKDNIEKFMSEKHGINGKQFEVLGLPRDQWWKKGWKNMLIGTEISDENYKKLLSLKRKFKEDYVI